MTLIHASRGVAAAEANMGRWVARCCLCPSASPYGMRFGTPAFECVECGTVTEIRWPSDDMRWGVERLLMMRPDPTTRNWLPHETLNDLMWENGQHGIFDDLEKLSLDTKPGDTLFSVTDTAIRVDMLPQLMPSRRLAVGS